MTPMKTKKAAENSTVYDSAHREPMAVEELKGAIRYRELIKQLVRRDLISRYKRSFLGVAWTMLNPLGTMLILTLVFSRLFHSVQGYPIYVLSGLIAWTFFSQTTSSALNQNVWGGVLLHRIYLPRTSFTLSTLFTGMVNYLLSLIPLALIMVVTRFPFHLSFVFLPVSILLLALFTLGLGLLFSTLAIYFPDVVDMFQVALTAWMYLTPVIYPAEIIPLQYQRWLFNLNPMYYFIEIIRQPIYDGKIPSNHMLLIGSLIAIVTLVTGWLVFTWKANELTYRT
jgi:ABC-type polysaccharide/polyol phosphate export permease